MSYTTDTTRPPEAEVAPAAPPSKVDALRAAIAEEKVERLGLIAAAHAAIKHATATRDEVIVDAKAACAESVAHERGVIARHRAAIEANRIPAKRKKK